MKYVVVVREVHETSYLVDAADPTAAVEKVERKGAWAGEELSSEPVETCDSNSWKVHGWDEEKETFNSEAYTFDNQTNRFKKTR